MKFLFSQSAIFTSLFIYVFYLFHSFFDVGMKNNTASTSDVTVHIATNTRVCGMVMMTLFSRQKPVNTVGIVEGESNNYLVMIHTSTHCEGVWCSFSLF